MTLEMLSRAQDTMSASEEVDLAPPQEKLSFPARLKGKWKLISLQPGTCTYRAAEHLTKYAFEEEPDILCEPDFFGSKRRAEEEEGSLVLLPCLHEVYADLYASPHWELLDGYWFHLKNPPLYLGRHPSPVPGKENVCAAIPCLRPLLTEADGSCKFEFLDVQTTQDAARVVMEDRLCSYCITNIYGAKRYNVNVVQELKCINVGWYLFQYSPKTWNLVEA